MAQGNRNGNPESVPMEQALSPDQCERMRRFLRALVWAVDECHRVGRKPDVIGGIKAWADRSMAGPQTGPRKGDRECAAGCDGN